MIFILLVTASFYDLRQYKVPNALCGAALIISLFRCYVVQGLSGTLPWLAGMVIPFILCFLLFHCRMLGAGDSKLLSVIGSMVGASRILHIMFVAIGIGAVFSVVKMTIHHNAVQRFERLSQYTTMCMQDRKCHPYYDIENEGEEGIIPFTIAVSLATLWCVFG